MLYYSISNIWVGFGGHRKANLYAIDKLTIQLSSTAMEGASKHTIIDQGHACFVTLSFRFEPY